MYKNSIYESSQIIENYYSVIENMKSTAKQANRDPQSVNLIVVTKTYSIESIMPLIEIGHRHFGENRVQEASDKWAELIKSYPDIKLHLIGHLQTNKTKKALEIFNTIHSIDSLKLINEVNKNMNNQDIRSKQFFLELNLGNEIQKNGILVRDLPNIMSVLTKDIEFCCEGYMCIPPFDQEPSPYFALLKKIADENKVTHTSMGMSSDYQKAIEFGSTFIRVGSQIFGKRV
ncbi:MAG: YggS family pyridoxal phosphate-dependent enzyme [Hyphomicrobiales bacterium]|jgi:PLP dependent protein|nr:YggS family pyridoxal phosphate-dependent enzyme [Hyphomicrobiales bacterium]